MTRGDRGFAHCQHRDAAMASQSHASNDSERAEPADRPSLVCVEYPGLVKDVSAMIDTLGGLDNIGRVVSEPNRRLELRFRPDDVFCKPTCGERSSDTNSFLLRVKRMRNKREPTRTKIETEIVGTVATTFKFQNLCDFQYLPMQRKEKDGEKQKRTYESIYDRIYFDRLVDSSWLEQSESSSPSPPLFLPPAAFSRMDVPQDYQYRRDAASDKSNSPYNIIGRTRQRRSHHAIFVTYDVDKVPDQPRDVALNQMKVKFISDEDLAAVKAMFQQQPVWSKTALVCSTGISKERVKFILPAMAYYFSTGPWRNQWVRLGYDPRKEPEAAMFQTLDYRVRIQGGARHKVKAKRSYANYLLPYKAMNFSKPKTSVIDRDTFNAISAKAPSASEDEAGELPLGKKATALQGVDSSKDSFVFRSDRVPAHRQMFYQFKDLEVEEAKEVIRQNRRAAPRASDGRATTCDEKNGWFEAGTDNKLRDVLTKHLSRHLANERDERDERERGDQGEEEEEEEDDEDDDDDVGLHGQQGDEFSSESDDDAIEAMQKKVLRSISVDDDGNIESL